MKSPWRQRLADVVFAHPTRLGFALVELVRPLQVPARRWRNAWWQMRYFGDTDRWWREWGRDFVSVPLRK